MSAKLSSPLRALAYRGIYIANRRQRVGRDPRKGRPIPGGRAAVFGKEGTHQASHTAARQSFPRLSPGIKSTQGPSLGSLTHPIQGASMPHFYPKAASLEQLLGVGKASSMHIPKTGGGAGGLQLPRSICGQLAVMSSWWRPPTLAGGDLVCHIPAPVLTPDRTASLCQHACCVPPGQVPKGAASLASKDCVSRGILLEGEGLPTQVHCAFLALTLYFCYSCGAPLEGHLTEIPFYSGPACLCD